MALHWSFGHLQLELWAKEGPGVKLAIWLPTTKSWESTRSQRVMGECNTALKSSWRGLQVWFRPRPNRRLERDAMMSQSPRSPNRDNLGTPLWESQDKKPFGCGCGGWMQTILFEGWWWHPSSPGRGESCKSKVARGLSQHQMHAEWVLTNLGWFWMQVHN
jgi:hypothetical protein